MTALDPELRRLKANAAQRLRREAEELHAQARAKDAQAGVIERAWGLLPQSPYAEPDLSRFSAQTGRWEDVGPATG